MTGSQASMFEEQVPLPGLANAGTRLNGKRPLLRRDNPAQVPLLAPVRDQLPEWPMRPATSQLRLDQNQLEITDAHPDPIQLMLFPEPPLWEAGAEESRRPGTPGRLSRKRSRLGITPGQGSLF